MTDLTPPIEDKIAALPFWQGRPRMQPLRGGISNLSVLASDGSGRYVVRLTRDFPFHNVSRAREVAIARAAHAAGFAPEIVYAAPGVMVSRHIEARTLTAADVVAALPRMAALLRRFHTAMPPPPPDAVFDVFAVSRGYIRALSAEAPDPRLPDWARLNADLEARQLALPPVFGHHDLLPGNWLDDGRRLWLIDFEYAGRGAPLFDLANLSSNAGLDADGSHALLAAYFGAPPTAELLAGHRTMEAASLLREALWSLISALHLKETGFDYRAYAEVNFTRLDAVLAEG